MAFISIKEGVKLIIIILVVNNEFVSFVLFLTRFVAVFLTINTEH